MRRNVWSCDHGGEIGKETEKLSLLLNDTDTNQRLKQMLVIAFHEFGHAITACCTGGRVGKLVACEKYARHSLTPISQNLFLSTHTKVASRTCAVASKSSPYPQATWAPL